MNKPLTLILSLFLAVILVLPVLAANSYEDEVLKFRAEKDAKYKTNSHSPLTEEIKKDFKGLHYFPVNEQYRFKVKLNEFKKKESLIIITSKGRERKAVRYGYFDITIDGTALKLNAYIFDDSPEYLFIPFKDKTSPSKSYGAGRYLDFDLNKTNEYDLDFNYAYNPYCAYNPKYSCPIPPEENSLPVEIPVGEMKYK